jgi:hypothetical protein
MKTAVRNLFLAATLVTGAVGAQAVLLNRGGGMIYDTELNITWLQDWNYARTSGYTGVGVNADGTMTWIAGKQWADNLVYGGFSDWRLPTMVDTGEPGCDYSFGGTECGYNVLTKVGNTVFSEMAHLYYETLGNKALYDTNGVLNQSGWGLVNTGPFTNMKSSFYWSGLEYATFAGWAWFFNNTSGEQLPVPQSSDMYVVAVRPGDVTAAVPEPQPLVMLLMGAAAVLVAVKRRAHGAAPL